MDRCNQIGQYKIVSLVAWENLCLELDRIILYLHGLISLLDNLEKNPKKGDRLMKIAISGKGGVGKTTFASFLIKALTEQGKKVLAIDADPDANLAQALGVDSDTEIIPISEMKEIIEERTEAKVGSMGSFFKLNPKVRGRRLHMP